MWYLYLDESGDLGFDFVNKKPSRFFTVAVLAVQGVEENRKLSKAIRVTLRRKLNPPGHRQRMVAELKGTGTSFEVKRYFYKQAREVSFGVYSITLNKRKVYERLTNDKARIYNFVTRQVLDKIPFEQNDDQRVQLVIDKSKSKPEIADFNHYLRRQLEGRINPKTPLDILHLSSHEMPGLQAADLFAWGIFQKYERGRMEWYEEFQEKIKFDDQYL